MLVIENLVQDLANCRFCFGPKDVDTSSTWDLSQYRISNSALTLGKMES